MPASRSMIPSRYAALRTLGRGGQGQVFLARDRELGRQVAVKLHAPRRGGSAERSRSRFEREARLTAALRHPALVEVLDFGALPSGVLFIIYEYVAGPTLDRVLTEGPPPPEQWIEWISPLASALDALHEAGVIHRDVKPSNVLLRGGTSPVLCDLGLASEPSRETVFTRTGERIGTPNTMAPEQWLGHRPEPATDQFGLASCVLALATGRTPWEEMPAAEAYTHALTHRPIPLPEGLPPGLDAALRRGLAPRPADRFPSCTAFAETLGGAIRGPAPSTEIRPPPPAPPPLPPERGPGLPMRGLASAALLAVAGLGLGALSGAPPPGPVPDRGARAEAEERLLRAAAPFRSRIEQGTRRHLGLPGPRMAPLDRAAVLDPRFPLRARRWTEALVSWTGQVIAEGPDGRRRFVDLAARQRFVRHANSGFSTLLADLREITRLDLRSLGASDTQKRLRNRRSEILSIARVTLAELRSPTGPPPHEVVLFEGQVTAMDAPRPAGETLARLQASLLEVLAEPEGETSAFPGAERSLEDRLLHVRYALLEGLREVRFLDCARRGRLLDELAAALDRRGPELAASRRVSWAGPLSAEALLTARRCPQLAAAGAAALGRCTELLPELTPEHRARLAVWAATIRERSLQDLPLDAPELRALRSPLEEWERRTASP